MITKTIKWLRCAWSWARLWAACVLVAVTAIAAAQTRLLTQPPTTPQLELSRAVRSWEFLSAVGRKAGVFGNETGTVEAWVYPLKIFRDFELVFHIAGRSIPAGALARNIVVRPEATTITYADESFSVEETLFVPRDEPGAIIALDVNTHAPLEVEARFHRDFQLMWPAALGGTYINWDENRRAFALGEEQKKWFALVGSPSAAAGNGEFETNYYADETNSFTLGSTPRGRAHKLIIIAGSIQSRADAEQTYQRLSTNYESLRDAAAKEYADYLQHTTSLQLPDADMQRAYDWARASVLQGVVANPFLGTGLIAGYRASGSGTRPGFAWFFGRDSLWTSLALNTEGDFATTRTALEFLMKYQRADGKVEHEISQSAAQVPWFKDYPYAYASADATPLFLIAVDDYLRSSGDNDFVRANWDHVWGAYQFLRSTWDARGLPQNAGVGHGWIEGGPLLPIKSEFYQSGLGVRALQAMSELARAAGKNDVAAENERLFQQHRSQLNDFFWSPERRFFAFAVDPQDRRLDTASVLTTVPMWFGVTDAAKSEATITYLADADHATDWGMRILSAHDPRFDPSGYHFGSVWPLFTGWASVGEYRYHRALPAYANLRANALLALNGAAGHATEVLSGAFFEPLSTSSPHQIWSSAMIISPLLRGLLGFEADTAHRTIRLAPHLPADWTGFRAQNLRMGSATYDVNFQRDDSSINFQIQGRNANESTLEFAPAVSARAKVLDVEVNGKKAPYRLDANSEDQHVIVPVHVGDSDIAVHIGLRDDFGLTVPSDLPPLGAASRNLKVVSDTWSAAKDSVTYEVAGVPGQEYVLGVRGSARIARVDGAELFQAAAGPTLRLRIPAGNPGYQHARVTIHFETTR